MQLRSESLNGLVNAGVRVAYRVSLIIISNRRLQIVIATIFTIESRGYMEPRIDVNWTLFYAPVNRRNNNRNCWQDLFKFKTKYARTYACQKHTTRLNDAKT